MMYLRRHNHFLIIDDNLKEVCVINSPPVDNSYLCSIDDEYIEVGPNIRHKGIRQLSTVTFQPGQVRYYLFPYKTHIRDLAEKIESFPLPGFNANYYNIVKCGNKFYAFDMQSFSTKIVPMELYIDERIHAYRFDDGNINFFTSEQDVTYPALCVNQSNFNILLSQIVINDITQIIFNSFEQYMPDYSEHILPETGMRTKPALHE